MSVENVKAQIDRFLKSADPEVLCIRGNWGTGKTYVWQTAATMLRDGKDNQYNQLQNPSDAQQTIIRNVGAALELIGLESAANKFKVEGWGIFQKIARLDRGEAVGNADAQ